MTDKKLITNRQFKIWLQIARGLTDKQIAHKLGLSPATVTREGRVLRHRLGARNRTEAALAFVFAERLP